MSRTLKLALIAFGLLLAGAIGYWFGGQHAKDAYSEHFISEAFMREYHEARHDLGIVRLLSEQKTEGALQMAQYRYYSRLLLAADAASKSSNNPSLEQMLHTSLREAKELQKTHPFRFPAEKDQKQWETLINSSR